MKFKTLIASLILGAAIAAGAYAYIGPMLISRGNRALDDNAPPFLAAAGSSAAPSPRRQLTPSAQNARAQFTENFDAAYIVKESGSMRKSNHSNWWLSSGAYFYSANGVGSTIAGSLSAIDPWRIAFLSANPIDTDNGYHPQNVFRLVLKSQWRNFRQEVYFRVLGNNLSDSPNRNASNGLLLFNRYRDSANLYYVGIRVDGYAVIKKKIHGVYYTMAYKSLITGSAYRRDGNPNPLPKNVWIGVRSEVNNNTDGTVSIKLFIDKDRTGDWVLAAEARDDGKSYGGPAFSEAGHGGIRTDFMDVEFSGYRIAEF